MANGQRECNYSMRYALSNAGRQTLSHQTLRKASLSFLEAARRCNFMVTKMISDRIGDEYHQDIERSASFIVPFMSDSLLLNNL